MSSSNSEAKLCAVCGQKFGMLLWRHTCSKCQRTVCDDCAPYTTSTTTATATSTTAEGDASKVRICQHCLTGVMTASAVASRSSAAGVSGGGGRRLGTASEQPRTSSQQPRSSVDNAEKRSNNNSSAPISRVSGADGSTQAGAPSATAPASNPVLEAALRRQQQNASRGHGGGVAASYSAEKTRLLREIDALLAAHGEAPPFGLRSSDEVKLRSYLAYVRGKYGAA